MSTRGKVLLLVGCGLLAAVFVLRYAVMDRFLLSEADFPQSRRRIVHRTVPVLVNEWPEKRDDLVGFFVDSEFPEGESVMRIMRRHFHDKKFIELDRAWTGADEHYEYASFMSRVDISGGFEKVYHQYVIFSKSKKDADWSKARAFLWRYDPFFAGPMKELEAKGEELNKEISPRR